MEISDADRTPPTRSERPVADVKVGGRGLPILAETGEWGTRVYRWGKTVWWEARWSSVPVPVAVAVAGAVG